MKWASVVLVAALVIQVGYVPYPCRHLSSAPRRSYPVSVVLVLKTARLR